MQIGDATRGQPRHGRPERAGAAFCVANRPTSSSSPTATEPPRHRLRRRHRGVQADVGRYGNKPDDAVSRVSISSGPRGSGNSTSSTASSLEATAWSMSSDRVERPDPGVHARRHVSEGDFIARGTLDWRGTSSAVAFSPDKDQEVPRRPRWRQRQGAHPQSADAAGARIRGDSPVRTRGQWHWLHSLADRFKGQPLHGRSRGNRLQKFNKRSCPASGQDAVNHRSTSYVSRVWTPSTAPSPRFSSASCPRWAFRRRRPPGSCTRCSMASGGADLQRSPALVARRRSRIDDFDGLRPLLKTNGPRARFA